MAERSAVVCVDFGSTFTKAVLVDLVEGRIVASASHPTTVDTDVLDGYAKCRAELGRQDTRAASAEVLALLQRGRRAADRRGRGPRPVAPCA